MTNRSLGTIEQRSFSQEKEVFVWLKSAGFTVTPPH